MQTGRSTVVSVFTQSQNAENAISALQNSGFSSQDIFYSQVTDKSQSGGGLLGSIKHAITGTGSSTEEGKSVEQDLMSLGLPSDAAHYYQEEYQAGHPVVAVTTDHPQQAINLLQNQGGYGYDPNAIKDRERRTATETTQTRQAGKASATDATAAQRAARQQKDIEATSAGRRGEGPMPTEEPEEQKIRLRQEQLKADKERVQTGEVDIHKEVITEKQHLDVPVSREEVVIERHAVTSGETDTTPIGEDETIRIPITEEKVHVEKTPIVTGEVDVSKRSVEETQRIDETTKREEVRVEEEGEAHIHQKRDNFPHRDIDNREQL